MTYLWVTLGVALIAAVVIDIWLTILHPDAEGAIAGAVRRLVWRASSIIAGRRREPHRTPLVWAGPVLVTGTFLAWIAPLVLGVALVVWPYIDGYHRIAGYGPAGFDDALYFAAGTLTVLGFGDLTPDTPAQKLFTVCVGALGFALFAALATYLIELITGLSVRNGFALAVHDQVRGTDGVGLLARSLTDEGLDAARQRCAAWAESLRAIDDTVRRYPLVALTYRPRRPDYDIEPALEQVTEATVAALLAARCDAWRGLGPRAEELAYALLRTQDTIARRYLGGTVPDGVAVRPTDLSADTSADLSSDAEQALRRLHRRLADELDSQPGDEPGGGFDQPVPTDGLAMEVLSRSLTFLDGLRGWSAPAVRLRHPDRS
ncbi:potassium channel family protein [Solwaraspora sp. WMMD406]|uniref:potassium channel family protein n=1 Tax=Solwaraspora sp. WMMD406 TaxID=3016095 RepID=UPI002418119C|nr:potassium channel family protein [Solwaraspora sp. WMMD406]MDG4765912.1 potassium channel family protein [Solwaraspora sp. WMMD406]